MTLCDALSKGALEQIGSYSGFSDQVLVSAQHGKGLYLLDGGQIRRVKPGSLTGLWIRNGELLYAYVFHDHLRIGRFTAGGDGDIIVNTQVGDIHDVRYVDDRLLVVSTVTNEIAEVNLDGELVKRHKFTGCGDAWHLNCLDVWNGRLVVSAFGEFEWHRQWKTNYKGQGFVVDAETRERLWTGLSQPHSPRMLPDGTKAVCDSQAQRVLVDRKGEITAIDFPNKYPRGLSFSDKFLYVGLSQSRKVDMLKPEDAKAGVAVVDLETLKVSQFVPLPVVEIYDVLVVPHNDGRN